MRASVILLLCFLFPMFLLAQPTRRYSVQDKKAIELYEKAVSEYHYQYYAQALNTLEKVKRRKAKFIEAYLLSAQIYEALQQFEEAYQENMRALALDSTFYPRAQLDAARVAFYSQRYAEGALLAERYLLKIDKNDKAFFSATQIQKSCTCRIALQLIVFGKRRKI